MCSGKWEQFKGAIRAGNVHACAYFAKLHVSPVREDIKINEQNKTIDIGPLCLHSEFVKEGLNSVGYRTLQYSWLYAPQMQD